MPEGQTTGAQTELFRYAGVGMQFAATIGVFAFAGYWVDGRLGSSPWLLILGVFVGFALGLISLVAKFSPRKRTPSSDDPEKP